MPFIFLSTPRQCAHKPNILALFIKTELRSCQTENLHTISDSGST